MGLEQARRRDGSRHRDIRNNRRQDIRNSRQRMRSRLHHQAHPVRCRAARRLRFASNHQAPT